MKRLNILVLGAGAYVCGRGSDGYGTVLPTLAECHRDGWIDRVVVAATRSASVGILQKKLQELNSRLGTALTVSGVPAAGEDASAYQKVLSEREPVDAAVVVTPDDAHFEQAQNLFESGVHCLVVKPLTPTVSEATRLVRTAESKGLYGAVEFHKRWDEANLFLKAILREQKIGKLRYVSVEYSQRKIVPSEMFRIWADQTNVFQYLGVHYADIIYFVTGALPVRAMAVGQKGWLTSRGIDTWDSIQAIVEWKEPGGNRFNSVFALNWIDPNSTSAMSNQKITVVGTEGRIDSDQKNRGIEVTTDRDGLIVPNPYFSSIQPGQAGKNYFRGYGYRSVRQFVEDVSAIREGTLRPKDLEGCRPTFRDALPSTAVVEAVNRSLLSAGEWISIPHHQAETAAVA